MRQHPMKSKAAWMLLIAVLIVAGAAIFLFWAPDRPAGEAPAELSSAPQVTDPVERGRRLVELGNCEGCHTVTGGHAFAGGRKIPTPFGTFATPNITPDTTS